MKKYNVIAQDANNNRIQIFIGIDEVTFKKFLNEYCHDDKDLYDENYRWLKDHELPAYNIPYRAMGWIIKFAEA